jgi:hypothetical protein
MIQSRTDETSPRPFCQEIREKQLFLQSQGESTRIIEVIQRLFFDFREVHSLLLASVVNLAVLGAGGGSRFDYSRRYLKINLPFTENIDEDGHFNPATSFRINSMDFGDIADLEKMGVLEPSRAKFKADDTTWKAMYPRYKGLLIVVFDVGTFDILQAFPIMLSEKGPDEDGLEKGLSLINNGLVIREVDGVKKFGQIRKESGKWRWRKLPGAAGELSFQGMSWTDEDF